MTLQEAKLLLAFNAWADNRIFDAVVQLPADQYTKEMNSSHGSIHGTLAHLVGAQKRWLNRWQGSPEANPMSPAEVPTLKDLKAVWEKIGFETAKFFGMMTDKKLQEAFPVTSPQGESYTLTFAQGLQHVVDHSTYHRGQIITLMRQLGVKPPYTGMVGFFRESGKLR